MSYATFAPPSSAPLAVLSLRLVLPLRGAWYAELELDATATEAPAVLSRCALSVGGRVWSGYVARVREWQGRTRLFFEAGVNGMRAIVPALQYESALVTTIAEQILTLAGETRADDASDPTDVLSYYHRTEAPAGRALSTALATIGLSWRFTDAGLVRWAAETWPAADETNTLELEPFGERAETEVELVSSALPPSLSPGETFGGRRVERVVYTMSEDEPLTAVLSFTRGEGAEGLRTALGRAVRAVVPELPYLGRYPASVVRQTSDLRLELAPDDMAVAGSPPVPPLYGLPGARCEVPEGARVGLVHEAGDATRPKAMGWEADTAATSIRLRTSSSITLGAPTCEVGGGGATVRLSGGGAGVARVNDIACYMLWDATLMTLYVAPSLTAPYVAVMPNPNTPNPPPTGTLGTPVTIGAGSEKVSAG